MKNKYFSWAPVGGAERPPVGRWHHCNCERVRSARIMARLLWNPLGGNLQEAGFNGGTRDPGVQAPLPGRIGDPDTLTPHHRNECLEGYLPPTPSALDTFQNKHGSWMSVWFTFYRNGLY